MPTLKTIKKSPLILVAAVLAFISGAATSKPAEAGWKLCVRQECSPGGPQCKPSKTQHCHKQVCKNVLVECPDGKEHVGTLNSTSDGGNF
jgi:hypothetical protein